MGFSRLVYTSGESSDVFVDEFLFYVKEQPHTLLPLLVELVLPIGEVDVVQKSSNYSEG